MPAIHFNVRWPDGSEDRCYSPSTVLQQHFKAGERIAIEEFVARADVALGAASQRVQQRFGYFCSSAMDQLAAIKAKAAQYEISVNEHPLREGVRDNTNHYVTGRDGGREIDLRKFATEGMELFGVLEEFDGANLCFRDNLKANLDQADSVYRNINARIDAYIDSRGITAQPGLYFIGLPWLHTWGSGRFSGVARDAEYLGSRIAAYRHPLTGAEHALSEPA
jgi:uncharacterized repeat protein (TIGR04042 family)